MSKKTPKPQEFANSPFKNLKGLSALDVPPVKPARGEKPVESVESSAEPEDELSFDEQMSLLGVAPIKGRHAGNGEATPSQQPTAPATPLLSSEERERNVFLEAVGRLDATFQDDWPEQPAGEPAEPRRMKQVERGKLVPEAQLDLHGLTIEQATNKVGFFLENARYQGLRTVLVITGRGLHSSDEPVLRRAVERQLEELRELVIEWGLAPRRHGGEGALVVFLRRQG